MMICDLKMQQVCARVTYHMFRGSTENWSLLKRDLVYLLRATSNFFLKFIPGTLYNSFEK